MATPLCVAETLIAVVITGDQLAPRQYDAMNRLGLISKSSLMTVVARTPAGHWQTQYSYNKAGHHGWQEPFPDLLPFVTAQYLNQLYELGTVQSTQLTLGRLRHVTYTLI